MGCSGVDHIHWSFIHRFSIREGRNVKFNYVLICESCRHPWIVADEMTSYLAYAHRYTCPKCGEWNPVPVELRREVARCNRRKRERSS